MLCHVPRMSSAQICDMPAASGAQLPYPRGGNSAIKLPWHDFEYGTTFSWHGLLEKKWGESRSPSVEQKQVYWQNIATVSDEMGWRHRKLQFFCWTDAYKYESIHDETARVRWYEHLRSLTYSHLLMFSNLYVCLRLKSKPMIMMTFIEALRDKIQ